MIVAKTNLTEIPQSCEICPYSKPYGFIGDRFCKIKGDYFTGNIKPPYKERPDECPLIKITDNLDVSVQSQHQKVGKWKLHKDGSGTCDQCNFTQCSVWDQDNYQTYCGHCGAKMTI